MKINELLAHPSVGIMEGLIKLPPKMLAKVKQEFYSVACSMSRVKCAQVGRLMMKNDDLTSGGLSYALKQFDEYFKKTYPGVKLDDVNVKQSKFVRKIGDFDDDDLDPRYRKAMEKSKLDLSYEVNKDPDKPLKLVMILRPEGDMKSSAGQYSPRPNTIEVSFERLRSFAWDEFLEHAQLAYDGEDEANEIKRMQRMLDALFDRITRLEGTLEHEVAHYIQFKVFGGVDRKQISFDGRARPSDDKSVRDKDQYFSSQIEFDPQIKSHAKSTIVAIRMNKRTKGMDDLTWKDMALIAVGQGTAADLMKAKKLPKWALLGAEQDFFESLKRVDYAQWKKAVKLFMQLVGEAFEK
jgi:hypothetical protein